MMISYDRRKIFYIRPSFDFICSFFSSFISLFISFIFLLFYFNYLYLFNVIFSHCFISLSVYESNRTKLGMAGIAHGLINALTLQSQNETVVKLGCQAIYGVSEEKKKRSRGRRRERRGEKKREEEK